MKYQPPTPETVFFRSCVVTSLLALAIYAAGLVGIALSRGWRP